MKLKRHTTQTAQPTYVDKDVKVVGKHTQGDAVARAIHHDKVLAVAFHLHGLAVDFHLKVADVAHSNVDVNF